MYYILEEDDGTWTLGTILNGSELILSFAEDNNVRKLLLENFEVAIYYGAEYASISQYTSK